MTGSVVEICFYSDRLQRRLGGLVSRFFRRQRCFGGSSDWTRLGLEKASFNKALHCWRKWNRKASDLHALFIVPLRSIIRRVFVGAVILLYLLHSCRNSKKSQSPRWRTEFYCLSLLLGRSFQQHNCGSGVAGSVWDWLILLFFCVVGWQLPWLLVTK